MLGDNETIKALTMILELQQFTWILGKLEVPLGIFNYSVLVAIKIVHW